MFLRRIQSKEETIPANQIPDEYKNVPVKVDEEIYAALKGLLGEGILPLKNRMHDTKKIQEEIASARGKIRFYSHYPVSREIKNDLQNSVFFNSFTNPKYEHGNNFTETFFKKNAMEEILIQLKVEKNNIEKIKAVYDKMDEKRGKINKLYPKDSSVIFILGKDPKNDRNIIVASNKSFLNVYAEGKTPQWITDYNEEGNIVSIPTRDLAKKIMQKGVVVVTANREPPPPIPGVTTLNIKRDNLFTIFPKEVWENEKNIARAIFKGKRESSRALYRSMQQRQKDKQDVEESLNKMSAAVNEAVESK